MSTKKRVINLMGSYRYFTMNYSYLTVKGQQIIDTLPVTYAVRLYNLDEEQLYEHIIITANSPQIFFDQGPKIPLGGYEYNLT